MKNGVCCSFVGKGFDSYKIAPTDLWENVKRQLPQKYSFVLSFSSCFQLVCVTENPICCCSDRGSPLLSWIIAASLCWFLRHQKQTNEIKANLVQIKNSTNCAGLHSALIKRYSRSGGRLKYHVWSRLCSQFMTSRLYLKIKHDWTTCDWISRNLLIT